MTRSFDHDGADFAEVRLQAGIVDVWSLNIKRALPDLATYQAQLDEDELRRAEVPRARRRYHEFVITRGALKQLLARQIGVPGAAIRLPALERGKPALAAASNKRGIHFNVSHSHGEALIAMTVGAAIGVDIEKIDPKADWSALSKRFFSPPEDEALRRCPAAQRRRAFFTCWTRKEALVKAAGDGIAAGLNSFTIDAQPQRAARLLRVGGDSQAAAEWSLRDLPVGEGYVAALAARRRGGIEARRHTLTPE